MANNTAVSNLKFSSWDLDPSILAAISNKGWEYVTQIQAEAIPLARSGDYWSVKLELAQGRPLLLESQLLSQQQQTAIFKQLSSLLLGN